MGGGHGADHCRIVGAEIERWNVERDSQFFKTRARCIPQCPIGADPTTDTDLLHVVPGGSIGAFGDQNVNHRSLK